VKESSVEVVLGFSKEEEVEDLNIEPKLQVITTFWRCGICFVGKNLLCFWFDDACMKLIWFRVVANYVQKKESGRKIG
jgi:hypothetical protein